LPETLLQQRTRQRPTLRTVVGVYSSGANAIAATLSDPSSKLGNYTLTAKRRNPHDNANDHDFDVANACSDHVRDSTLSNTTRRHERRHRRNLRLYASDRDHPHRRISNTLRRPLRLQTVPTISTATTTVLLTVNKASLTVTPNPSSKVYGTGEPSPHRSITGLVTGDHEFNRDHTRQAATTSTAIGVYSLGANAMRRLLSDPGSRLGQLHCDPEPWHSDHHAGDDPF